MALIVKDTLIRKRDGALPAGSSGFFCFIKEGRADLKLKGAIQGGKEKRKQLYPNQTADSHCCDQKYCCYLGLS